MKAIPFILAFTAGMFFNAYCEAGDLGDAAIAIWLTVYVLFIRDRLPS